MGDQSRAPSFSVLRNDDGNLILSHRAASKTSKGSSQTPTSQARSGKQLKAYTNSRLRPLNFSQTQPDPKKIKRSYPHSRQQFAYLRQKAHHRKLIAGIISRCRGVCWSAEVGMLGHGRKWLFLVIGFEVGTCFARLRPGRLFFWGLGRGRNGRLVR